MKDFFELRDLLKEQSVSSERVAQKKELSAALKTLKSFDVASKKLEKYYKYANAFSELYELAQRMGYEPADASSYRPFLSKPMKLSKAYPPGFLTNMDRSLHTIISNNIKDGDYRSALSYLEDYFDKVGPVGNFTPRFGNAPLGGSTDSGSPIIASTGNRGPADWSWKDGSELTLKNGNPANSSQITTYERHLKTIKKCPSSYTKDFRKYSFYMRRMGSAADMMKVKDLPAEKLRLRVQDQLEKLSNQRLQQGYEI